MNGIYSGLLLTWLDVERTFKHATRLWKNLPSGVQGVDCFVDGVEIRHTDESSAVLSWVKGLFPNFDVQESGIPLSIGSSPYPVLLQSVAEKPRSVEVGQTYPLWRDVTYLGSVDDEPESPQKNQSL